MSFFLYLISPILSLPFILLDIRNGKKSAVLVFAIFLGSVAYCTIPLQDLFRHLVHYENYSSYGLSDYSYWDFEMNGIVVYVYSLMSHLHIPFDFLRLLTTALSFYLFYKIFDWKIKASPRSYSNKEYFIHFLILTFFFDITYTIAGVRYGVALSFFMYGTHQFIERKSKVLGAFWLICSFLYHPSFLFLTISSYALYFLKINKKTIIVFSLIAFFAMSYFFQHFGYLLGVRESWYVNNSGGSSDYKAMTVFGFLGFILPKMCGIPIAVLLLKYFNAKSGWMRLSLSWLVLSIICLNNAVFLYRIWWGFMATGIYVLIEYEILYGINRRIVKRFLLSSVLFTLFSLIPFKNFILQSKYEKLLFPAPYVFSEHYTSSDVLKQCPTAGDFVNK